MEGGAVPKEKKLRLTKADLDARFSAQQEKNRLRRETKVTREDVEKLLSERKARRAEKAVPGRRGRTVSLSLGIVLLAGSCILAVTTSASTDAFNHTIEFNEHQIAAAKGDLAAIPAADQEASAKYAAALEKQIGEATVKGDEVAKLQQKFATILFQGNDEVSGNGAPSKAFRNAVEHRKLLAPYFVDRAMFVDDALAYAPGSVLPFGPDEIDPRFPWYVSYEPGTQGRVAMNPAMSGWELASMVATSTQGVLEATWLNASPKTGELFAWATASYHVDPGAFGGLTVGLTTLGERGIPSMSKAGE